MMTERPADGPPPDIPASSEFAATRRLKPVELLNLFSRPRRFFARGLDLSKGLPLFLATWFVGMAAQQNRIDSEIGWHDLGMQRSAWRVIGPIADGHWVAFWGWTAGAGLVSGGILYLIGGWWYRMRLRLSGAPKDVDKTAARAVFIYASLVTALPTMLLTLGFTFVYASYMAAYNSDELLSSFVIIFLFWSVAVSYAGATEAFDITRWKARLWFLVLPALFYLVVISATLGVFTFFSEGI